MPESSLASTLLSMLSERGQTLAVAESLTGGLVSGRLTEIGGSSAVVRGGLVVYATDLKAALLGVDAEMLAAGGPVQAGVATAMARGVRRLCRADWGLATTGVAGPGAADGHPAGTVFVAVSGAQDAVRALDLGGLSRSGGREAVRHGSVDGVLGLAVETIGGHT